MKLDCFTDKKVPYICTPLTGKTSFEVLEQLQKVLLQTPDMIEWRADFFSELANIENVLYIVQQIKKTTAIPLLFTIRAEHEGGERISLSESEKVHILSEVCKKTTVEMIDYETSNPTEHVQAIRNVAKEYGKTLILSYHNFTSTPPNEELVQLAKKAASNGADIAKFAVMPETKEDVLRLLEVTKKIDNMLDVPIVSMSMDDLGGLSRIIGWAYGSIITFGVGVELSAPGQIPVKQLREAIDATQRLIPSWE